MTYKNLFTKTILSILITSFCTFTHISAMNDQISSWNPKAIATAFWIACKNRLFGQFKTDSFQIQGAKESQQDRIINNTINGIHFIGVTDGHGPLTVYDKSESKEWKNNSDKSYVILTKKIEETFFTKLITTPVLDTGATAANYIAHKAPHNIAAQLPRERGIIAALMSLFKKRETLSHNQIKELLQKALIKTDNGLRACLDQTYSLLGLTNERKYGGTTLALAFPYQDSLWCVHVGDSRIVVFAKDSSIVYASDDHKPNRDDEKARIEKAFADNNLKDTPLIQILSPINSYDIIGYRIGKPAGLTVSRSFGDFFARVAGVTAEPEIKAIPLKDVDTVVVGCDGIFDSLDDNDKMNQKPPNNILKEFMHNHKFKKGLAQLIVNESCTTRWYGNYYSEIGKIPKIYQQVHDNMSAIVAKRR